MNLVEAERAWRLAKSAPTEALRQAQAILAHRDVNDEVSGLALAARGRAHFELGNNDRAIIDLRGAEARVPDSDRPHVAIALAAALAAGGDTDDAIALLAELAEVATRSSDQRRADPEIRGLARSQIGYLLMHRGDLRGGAEALERSIDDLQRFDDQQVALARCLLNLGYCWVMLGSFDRSLEVLDRARQIGELVSEDLLVTGCLQNRAYALSCLGELPAALTELERARRAYEKSGAPGRMLSTLYDDFAETYRLAGLTGDAVRHAQLAFDQIDGGGNLEQEADATYRLAVCLLDHGDHEQAIDAAERAKVMFGRAGRSLWETRATLIALEAASAELAGSDDWFDRAEWAIDQLEGLNWQTDALRLRNRVAMIGLRLGRAEWVERFVVDRAPTADQSVVGRLEGLLHQTIADLHHGRTAADPLNEAWATLQVHRQRLADPELRAGSGRLAEAFRFMALVEASSSGDPATILAAEERWRAASLRLPRARPSKDPDVAATAQRLREASRQARESDSPDLELDRQIRRLEDRLRRLSHQTSAAAIAAGAPPSPIGSADEPDRSTLPNALAEELGGRRLVEWYDHRGTLYGLGVEAGNVERWEVGETSEIRSTAERIRRDLARLLAAPMSGDTTRRWRRVCDRAAGLGRSLFDTPWEGPGLVLSPPGPLRELPWALLAPGRGVPITVSSSATSWLQGHRRADGHDAIGEPALSFLAGPDLAEAQNDHRAALHGFPAANVIAGADRQALADAIGSADLLHIAAHGTFRATSPMFSSIRLADGDFALHELADFDRVPAIVALAACDAGRSLHLDEVAEQLGAAPAWLGAGVQTVIAPICAVPDGATAQVFNRFYDALPGRTPAEALARVWTELADAEPDVIGTAAALLCFGNGGPTIGSSDRA